MELRTLWKAGSTVKLFDLYDVDYKVFKGDEIIQALEDGWKITPQETVEDEPKAEEPKRRSRPPKE